MTIADPFACDFAPGWGARLDFASAWKTVTDVGDAPQKFASLSGTRGGSTADDLGYKSAMREQSVRLEASAAQNVTRGHPWVWRRGGDEAASGAVVRLEDPRGTVLGYGVYEAGSPIAIRVWSLGPVPLTSQTIEARLDRAFALRASYVSDGTTAYRLLNGEGDRTPGWVIDRYADVAVVKADGEAAEAHLEAHANELRAALQNVGIASAIFRKNVRNAPTERHALFGPPPPDKIEVKEHGVPFVVDLLNGQKTGAFLDQRENRARVGAMTRSIAAKHPAPRVLNLFSYAGGFSLHAALGGAAVTSVDIASGAHATAQASFRLAGVDPAKHSFVTADVFAFLEDAKKKKLTWDLVISDPPSFAPSEKHKARAIQAYRKIHRACADVLAPGAIFCASSCSSHVSAEDFATTLDDQSLGRSDLRLLEMYGNAADHPTLPTFPEGRYLKFFVLG